MNFLLLSWSLSLWLPLSYSRFQHTQLPHFRAARSKAENKETTSPEAECHCSTVGTGIAEKPEASQGIGQSKGCYFLEELGFALHKGDFWDSLCLRYGWQPTKLPCKCECGASYNNDHALCCNKGGFPMHRHNEIRDFTANVLTEVCHDVP